MKPLQEWQQYMAASGLSHNTIQVRTATIQALTSHAGLTDPLDLQPHHAAAFLARHIKPWTRLTYWNSIDAWCRFLQEWGHPCEALLKGIVRPRTPAGVPRPIDDTTITRLLALRLSPRARAYIDLALYASLRVHEIAKIRGEDFDGEGWLMVTGKGGNTAPIPVHPEIARLAETMPEFGFWFPSQSSPFESVNPVAVSKTITAALRSVGSTATAHQLRDTSATKMQRQMKDMRLTQTMLRHRSIRSTAKYAGVADDSMQQAVLCLSWGAA
jgi:integrase/recombinase XerD